MEGRASSGRDLGVSVIVPAYNAAATLAEPLDSLLRQTHSHFEAIIVDDGSSDATLGEAQGYAARDSRVRVVHQANAGVSVARNTGVEAARHDWLLFLDSDDTIAPTHLERLTDVLAGDDSLDAVRCGWTSVTQDGFHTCESAPRRVGDLFEELAVDWRFAIHACVVRRTLVEEVGGFQPGLLTSEDWDFWQRVARVGARFGAVPEILAFYRMREGSASKQSQKMLVDAVRVLEQGHASDPRVPRPHPVYPEGLEADHKVLAFQKLYFLCFSAGLSIGVGEDPEPLFELVSGATDPTLDPYCVADWVTSSALDAAGRPLADWPAVWAALEPAAVRYFEAFERFNGSPGLARRAEKLARGLVRLKTVHLGPTYRLRAFPAWSRLAVLTLRKDAKAKFAMSVGWGMFLLTQALRMVPSVYARYRKFRRRNALPESRANFETFFEKQADPWGYTNAYEQTKYEQTLELIPEGPFEDVLELACAEGHFTHQLAPCAGRLLATDISGTALERAAERCKGADNIEFQQLDMTRDEIPGRFDLIVCSEVLYYFGRRDRLRASVDKLTSALKPGGRLVMAHAHLAVDDPEGSGFDWSFNYGVEAIREAFSAAPKLDFEQELQTKFYRIQRFRQTAKALGKAPEILRREAAPPPADVVRHWVEGGTTDRLPILMYHRIAASGSEALAPYRVTPDAFEAQIRFLSEQGFKGVSVHDWSSHIVFGSALPRGAVAITFDDGYVDFLEHAWPVLDRYGFSATVFLVADRIGGSNTWDSEHGETIPLLDWPRIRELQASGIEFGSHTASHAWLPSLSSREVVAELTRSRQHLEDGLGTAVDSLAYPWGAFNKRVQFLAGACGYEVGVSTAPGTCEARHALLALPRLEIEGSDSLESFAAKLERPSVAGVPNIVPAAIREPVLI